MQVPGIHVTRITDGGPKARIDIAASIYLVGVQARITVWDYEITINVGKSWLRAWG